MTRKLLVICGPTATGKTKLALNLAKKFKGELVSADSRQVYRGMDIGTGKDLPVISNFQFPISKLKKDGIGCYEIEGVRVWGYDLVGPTQEFSVAQYVKIARKIIKDIWRRGKLPILVGGTGLYIKGVVDGIATLGVPKDVALRASLAGKKVNELFELLAQLDPVKAASMNKPDRVNPRRLVRAIEVADYKVGLKGKEEVGSKLSPDEVLFIGLRAPTKFLFERINIGVEDRIKKGFGAEMKVLFDLGTSWNMQSMNSLGYRQWKDYVFGEKTREEVIDEWKKEERKYARRQMTWFKKNKRIRWLDISKHNWQKSIEKLVRKWYKS